MRLGHRTAQRGAQPRGPGIVGVQGGRQARAIVADRQHQPVTTARGLQHHIGAGKAQRVVHRSVQRQTHQAGVEIPKRRADGLAINVQGDPVVGASLEFASAHERIQKRVRRFVGHLRAQALVTIERQEGHEFTTQLFAMRSGTACLVGCGRRFHGQELPFEHAQGVFQIVYRQRGQLGCHAVCAAGVTPPAFKLAMVSR